MVTAHFGGSLVLHPDTRDSFDRKLQNNLHAGRCRFGYECLECKNFLDYEQYLQKQSGKPRKIVASDCQLYKHETLKEFCPGRRKQKECGTDKKTFGIDYKTYNIIADRTAHLYHNRKHKLIFAVLTLPPLKKQTDGKEINEAFSRFIENCRSTYHLLHYIAVREGDGIDKRIHYHVILDIGYVSFTNLNTAWNSALSDICEFSICAFRTKKKSFYIRDIAGAIRYISKYISKSIGERSDSRIFFCDRETAQAFVKTRFDNDIEDLRAAFPSMERRILNDYVCRFTFRTKKDQNVFFHTVVKILFNQRWNTAGVQIYTDPPPD